MVSKNILESMFEINHGTRRQIRPMEGMRGLAVFMVFMVHYVTLIEPWLMPSTYTWSLTTSLRHIGNAGVDLFFVLSGYLIYGTLITKPRSFAGYIRRRIERIYPAFLAVFLIYLVLSWQLPQQSKIPTGSRIDMVGYIIANLLLLPGLFPIEPMITVAWSLSYEMFYYLAIPALIGLLQLRRWPSSARILTFLFFSIGFVLHASIIGNAHARIIMFIAGILLFEVLEYQVFPRIDKLGLVALIAGLLIFNMVANGPMGIAVLFVSFLAVCYAAFSGGGLTSRAFSWTPLRWLGNMSYSYYLIHGLALKATFLVYAMVYPPEAAWGSAKFFALMPLMFVFTLIPSGLLFIVVEKPISLSKTTGINRQVISS